MAASTLSRSGSICRRCLETGPDAAERCPHCGSPRVLRHPELNALAIAHLDCDAFYAAVEKRDRPELADLPVIVGGGKRGVVTTACYIARIRGVRSAMPMYQALKACPDAVVIPPDMKKYAGVGREVRALMSELTPLVEPVSIDEAFLDLTGTEQMHRASPALQLVRLAARIEKEIGISVSVGLSFNKFLAKLASDLNKPRGFSVIGRADAVATMAPMPVSRIWGVGKVLQARLEKDGIRRIGQLQTMDEGSLIKAYGLMGQRLFRLARAEDNRSVSPHGDAKSVSAETTFDNDVANREELVAVLRHLSERVSASLKAKALAGRTVTLKLRTPDFRIRSRSRSLADPTQLADRIWRTASEMLAKEKDIGPLRLIGVGISEMEPVGRADPPDLVDPTSTRRAGAERAMDSIRERFGPRSVDLGLMLGRGPGRAGRPREDLE